MSLETTCTKYFGKRNRKVCDLAGRKRHAEEDYHQLRLHIKKMKAFLTLLSHASDLKERKITKEYKAIFKKAGSVRDIQVAISLLEKERPAKWLHEYCDELRGQAQVYEKEFYSEIDDSLLRVLRKVPGKLEPYIKKVKRGKVRKYFSGVQKEIREIVERKNIKVAEAHGVRKMLKQLVYNRKFMKERNRDALKRTDAVQELLGTWHDYEMLCERLRADGADSRDAQRKKHLATLEVKLAKKRQALFKQVKHSLKTLKRQSLKSPAKKRDFSFLIRSRAGDWLASIKPAKT